MEALCGPSFQLPYSEVAVTAGSRAYTLLHLAVLSGRAAGVASVLHQGAQHSCPWSWDVPDAEGFTPLCVA